MRKSLQTLFALLLLSLIPLGSIANEEPLHPDDAFRLTAKEVTPGIIEASWAIADGYYLYRDKFKFSTATADATVGAAEIPPGTLKEDPIFGNVETFRDKVTIRVPVSVAAGVSSIELEAVSQGCADLGLCYPPQKKTVSVSVTQATAAAPALNLLAALNRSLGGDDDELLPPEQAFAFEAKLAAPNLIVANWIVADKYYMYQDKLKASLEANGVQLGEPQMPPSTIHADPAFGDVAIWRGPVTVQYPLSGPIDQLDSLTFNIEYQGCADLGVCYPPIKQSLKFDKAQLASLSSTGSAAVSTAVAAAASTAAAPPAAVADAPEMVSEQDAIADKLASGNTGLTLLMFFGLGLLLAFTPCVFPMIPILSGIIIGEGKDISTRRAFMLALAYVLAMALTYTIVGVLAGLFGANIQVWFQNPWVLSVFAFIFVLLSLSMFGFYELQMPGAIQSKLAKISNKQEGGKMLSAAIMGVLSALIVGPCVTAPLIGALIYIGQTGDAVLGGLALFSLSLGMGAPLLLIGASAGKLLPRAGMWMEAVKGVFGVLLLGVAIWLLERILPLNIIQLLSGLLMIASAVYMGALKQIPATASGWHTLWKGLGFALLVYGTLMLVGAAAGSNGLLSPLKGIAVGGAGGQAASVKGMFTPVKGPEGLATAIAQANASGKPVMLDFYADWCVSCKEMESFTFSDPGVQNTLSKAVLLKADVTANDAQDQALLKQFGLFGPPAILYFDTNGQERKGYRVVGFMPADKFNSHSANALQ